MKEKKTESKRSNLRQSLTQWVIIGLVVGLLYITGLHTPLIAGLQRIVLYTGLLDARVTDISEIDGPFLDEGDYQFFMQRSDGSTDELSAYKGKVTFVNVWASWCPPCLAEMPTIEKLYNELSDSEDIAFIMLSADQDRNAAVEFMEGKNYTMPYHFPGSPIPAQLQTGVLPTTFVISADGQIVYRREGIADYSSPAFREWLVELSELNRPVRSR